MTDDGKSLEEILASAPGLEPSGGIYLTDSEAESYREAMEGNLPLREELRRLLNQKNIEQTSDTPDFILASFMLACLSAFEGSVVARDKWWGFKTVLGQGFDD